MQSAHSCSIPAHWHSGWLAGWLMLHKETRFKFSRYLSIFEDKTHQHHWLVGWLAGWAGWLGGVGWLVGWLSVAVGWLTGCGWPAGWLAGSLWLPGWLASCFYQNELGAAERR